MTKDTLKKYQRLRMEQENLRDILQKLDAVMTAPKVQRLRGMPTSGGNRNALEDIITRHMELEYRYINKLAELDQLQAKIEDAIETLDGTQRMLIRMRYIQGMHWEDICVSLNYSWRRVHQIHAAALRELQK